MPAQAVIKRKLGTIPYQASVRNTLTLDRDGVLVQLTLRLVYTVTNGATGPVGPLWQTLARLIRRVDIIVDGQDTFVSLSGAHLVMRALFDTFVRQYGMDATVVLTNSAVTVYEVHIPIFLTLPPTTAARADDCALDMRQVTQAQLGVTWGDVSDLFTTPNANTAVSAVTLNVEAHYLLNPEAGKRNGQKAVYLVRSMDQVDVPNVATNPNMSVLIDRGQDIFWRSFQIVTLRNNIAVNNILDGGDIRLQSGSFVYVNREAVIIRSEPRRTFQMPVAEFDLAGVYRLELPWLGQNTTTINAGALASDLQFVFGTTYTSGTELISISREAIRPLRNRS